MNKVSVAGLYSLGILVAMASCIGMMAPAMAQQSPVPSTLTSQARGQLAADLAYPNSTQRFFDRGNAQFELEIQRLLADDDQPKQPLLTVQPEVLKELDD